MDQPDAYAYELRITLPSSTMENAVELSEKIDEALSETLNEIDAEIVQGEVYTY